MGRDPDYLAFIRRLRAVPASPGPAPTVEELRKEHAADLAAVPRPAVDHVHDLVLDGPAGPLPARLYRPRSAAPVPGLVYLHGGGWALGDVESYDPVVRALTVACGIAFVSVDYRRPPENRFPAAVDDAVGAVEQVRVRAGALGLDAARIGIAGDSAGGQIAAAATLRIRAAGGPPPALQLLVYPAVDLRAAPPAPADPDGLSAGPSGVERVVAWYVGDTDRTLPQLSPLLAPDLAGLPPAVIATAEYDRLCAQGRAYAWRLADAGVPTTYLAGTGLDHGYLGWGSYARRPAEVIGEIGAAVARALPR